MNTHVKAVDTSAKKVTLAITKRSTKTLADGSKKEVKEISTRVEDYDFLHFLPPMGAAMFVIDSGLSIKSGKNVAEGWIAVD